MPNYTQHGFYYDPALGMLAPIGHSKKPAAAGGASAVWDSGNTSVNYTLSGGDLIITMSANYTAAGSRADTACSGKCYWRIEETTIPASGDTVFGVGVIAGTSVNTNWPTTYSCVAIDDPIGLAETRVNNSYAGDGIGTGAEGSIIDIAFDADNYLFWARLNGTGNWNANGSANPATGTGGISVTSGQTYYPYIGGYGGDVSPVYTGIFQDDSSGTAPSGFSWLS